VVGFNVIDRRLNPSGKSLPNRQRFLRLAKEALREAVARSIRERPLADVEKTADVEVPTRRIAEPRLRHATSGGDRAHVLPGNKEFVQGDTLPKPPGGVSGPGREGAPEGEGEDVFRFTLTADEYLSILFEELELPDLAKTRLRDAEAFRPMRAGHSVTGSPTNLNLVRTMRHSLARRISLRRPRAADAAALDSEICALEADGENIDQARLDELRARRDGLRARARRIAYIDPVDLRYNRFQPTPQPNARAVMFCLMDVSASMTEDMKDLAKRFFLLLHLFLRRKYKSVDIVFIRHTSEAKEVDEEAFFGSRETGGTVVSSALREMRRIAEARYSSLDWNIYVAQASDGDNYPSDSAACVDLMEQQVLPICQYFAYVEVHDSRQSAIFYSSMNVSELWKNYQIVAERHRHFAMKRVFSKADVFPVFHELFAASRKAA
jgi:uncharacterized sporulation protein YeaH/YhbH (DUF444 family)